MSKKSKNQKSKGPKRARTADKHVLYEKSVQNTEIDVEFLEEIFASNKKKRPMKLREDFCGTASLVASWVASHKNRSAVGLDLDVPTLEWAEKHNLSKLTDKERKRATLLEENVMTGPADNFDVVVGFNFSYCIFKERADIIKWMRNAHAALKKGGGLFLDSNGGSELTVEQIERREVEDFVYCWDQQPYNPINGEAIRAIHFEFDDGSALKNAFVYDWRIWSLPELRDCMLEAGFSEVEVYWEGCNRKGEGNGIFTHKTDVEQELAWIAYMVGWK